MNTIQWICCDLMYSVKATYLFIGKAVEHSNQKALQRSHIRTTMSRQIPKKDIYGISHNIQNKSIKKNHPTWVHCDYFDRQWFKKEMKKKSNFSVCCAFCGVLLSLWLCFGNTSRCDLEIYKEKLNIWIKKTHWVWVSVRQCGRPILLRHARSPICVIAGN